MLIYQHVMVGTISKLPAKAVRKVGMRSDHHDSYA